MSSWDAIGRIGAELGATPEAIRKWRERGVPRFWRYDLIKADQSGEINEADFDRPPNPPKRKRTEEAA